MEGQILSFDPLNNSGVILGSNGNYYHFSSQSWADTETFPQKDLLVHFEINNGITCNVYVIEKKLNIQAHKKEVIPFKINRKKAKLGLKIFIPVCISLFVSAFAAYNIYNHSIIRNAMNFIETDNPLEHEGSINDLEKMAAKQQEILNRVSTIPKYPLSPYEYAQQLKEKLKLSLQEINKKREHLYCFRGIKEIF